MAKKISGILFGVFVLFIIYIFFSVNIGLEDIINFTPENVFMAALMMVVFYGLKSLTVVIPLPLLEIASGLIFSLPVAIIVNATGIMFCILIPHFVGRSFGKDKIDSLIEKHPKLNIVKEMNTSSFFICYFTRLVGVIPIDLLSLYFGASGVSLKSDVLGGFSGTFVSMVLLTVFGQSIRDPGSKMFWISIGLNVVLVVVSFMLFNRYR
ncbi:MAG: TVP38/TMEM64 family protein, partial [Erysipelotrichaceae bacterium]